MEVKIDTKEKFTVVSPVIPTLSAIIAAELVDTCSLQLQKPVKNVVLNLQSILTIEQNAAETLVLLQQSFYEHSASFVICSLQPSVEEALDKLEFLELLNITPTESEAWDIVQMEEIERELLDGDDVEFDAHS